VEELERHLNVIEDIESRIQELYIELADEQEEARKLYIELGKEYHLIEKKPKLPKKPRQLKAKQLPSNSFDNPQQVANLTGPTAAY
jgi:hypothetical protein